MDAVGKARLAVANRPLLVRSLDEQVSQGKLSAEEQASLLLVADMQAHLIFALETAPFLRAGELGKARALEAALAEGVWRHLDPKVVRLYEALRDHYLGLTDDLTPRKMKAWAEEALAFLAAALRETGPHIQFNLVRAARPPRGSPAPSRRRPSVSHHDPLAENGGMS
jgi:hypothetical protein